MVYAKTAKEAARLTQSMGEGGMQKTYLAVLTGCPEEKSGTLEDLLFHDRVKNKTYVVRRPRGGVKKAVLSYEIRVQFASRGFPLLGDGKYGSRDNRCTCALWSFRLTLPTGSRPQTFESLPPHQSPWTQFPLPEIL